MKKVLGVVARVRTAVPRPPAAATSAEVAASPAAAEEVLVVVVVAAAVEAVTEIGVGTTTTIGEHHL